MKNKNPGVFSEEQVLKMAQRMGFYIAQDCILKNGDNLNEHFNEAPKNLEQKGKLRLVKKQEWQTWEGIKVIDYKWEVIE